MKDSEFNKGFYRGRNGALFISSIFWMIVILIILMCSCSSYEVTKKAKHPRYESTKERHHPQPKPKL